MSTVTATTEPYGKVTFGAAPSAFNGFVHAWIKTPRDDMYGDMTPQQARDYAQILRNAADVAEGKAAPS